MSKLNRRLGLMATAVSGIMAVTAVTASAHHCYKAEWEGAAYAAMQANNTAWVSLSDLGRMFIIAPEDLEECGHMADKAVKGFMEENNLTQEPMIHSKAITGGGAYYKKGKEPKPFNYLTEDQFMQLDMDMRSLVAECKGDDGNGEEEAS